MRSQETKMATWIDKLRDEVTPTLHPILVRKMLELVKAADDWEKWIIKNERGGTWGTERGIFNALHALRKKTIEKHKKKEVEGR